MATSVISFSVAKMVCSQVALANAMLTRAPKESERYAFDCEWFDSVASLIRKYTLLFFVEDSTVEIVGMLCLSEHAQLTPPQVDVKARRVFLKRHKVEDVRLRDLFVGASVNILARQFHITGFTDEFTRRKLGSKQEKTFAMIKPDAISQLGNVIAVIESSDLTVASLKMTRFARSDAERKCLIAVCLPSF